MGTPCPVNLPGGLLDLSKVSGEALDICLSMGTFLTKLSKSAVVNNFGRVHEKINISY